MLLARAALGPADSASAADGQKKVLVLYSTRQDTQLPIVGERELPRIFGAGLAESVDYHTEYLDVARFPDPEYQAAFRDFLYRKYSGQRFDIVIAVQDVAFQFVDVNRDELFPDTPVVFSATDRNARRLANSTGVIVHLDLSRTLTLATALQPDINQVFVVTGTSSRDKVYESLAQTQFQSFERRLTFTYLSGLPTKELEQRVAALPEQSIVYYLLFYQDGAGENFQPLEYLDRLAVIANRPIYSWVDSAMARGIVGGSLQQQASLINAVGDSALRVLRGERADDIPTAAPDLNIGQVDWRQLRRWGISEARVPAGTRLLFREPSIWNRYKVYILGAVTLLMVQTGLLAGLFVQRTRRRKSEDRARASQAELRASYEQIRDLGGRLLTAQESERSRIARELHDDISQEAALLAIDLQRLCGPGQERDPDAGRLAREAADRAQGIARSVRDLSHRLHPATLQIVGLVAALDGLQRELSQPGIALTFSHGNVPAALPHDLTLCLFRIAQEALQNAVKHSAAHNVSVHLGGGPKGLALKIVDDGVGFDVDAVRGRGLGLISMRERLESLGGTLKIQSWPGAGTHVEAAVPFRAAEVTEAL
jgi:signal transduction histidine kinase